MDEARYLQMKKENFIQQIKDDIEHYKRVNEWHQRDIASFTKYTQEQIEKLETYNMTPGEKEQEKGMLEYRQQKDTLERSEDIEKNKKLILFMQVKLKELE
mgnify:CR=1 FL=1